VNVKRRRLALQPHHTVIIINILGQKQKKGRSPSAYRAHECHQSLSVRQDHVSSTLARIHVRLYERQLGHHVIQEARPRPAPNDRLRLITRLERGASIASIRCCAATAFFSCGARTATKMRTLDAHGAEIAYHESVRFEREPALARVRRDPLEGRRGDDARRVWTPLVPRHQHPSPFDRTLSIAIAIAFIIVFIVIIIITILLVGAVVVQRAHFVRGELE
jgi:hypothetical protein